jgi:hypothetical protein
MIPNPKPFLFTFFFFATSFTFAGGIPKNIPDDFNIHYYSHIGYNSHFREIELKQGECTGVLEPSEGLVNTTFKFTISFDEISSLYNALRILKAFTIKSKPAKYADRGGERIEYTVSGKHYFVSNYGASFVVKSHYEHFIESVDLITALADRYKH